MDVLLVDIVLELFGDMGQDVSSHLGSRNPVDGAALPVFTKEEVVELALRAVAISIT